MIGKLDMVVLDAADIVGLSAFYRGLAGWEESPDSDADWITLRTPDGWQVALQKVAEHRSPQWPGQARPQQAHLDLRVADLDAAHDRVLELGGTLLRKNEQWYTVADPAGHPFDLCVADVPQVTLAGVMLDCPDAKALAAFYSEVLGKPVTYEGDEAAMIGEDGAQPVLFQQVADYTPPRWPDPAYPQQYHLDIEVDDLDEGERAVLPLGATRLERGGKGYRVFADPAGKPFCLTHSGD